MRSLVVIALLVVAVAALLFLPVQVPYNLSVPGKVMPAREWLLVRDQEGSIGALLRDNMLGSVQSYNVNRFERGDAVRFTLARALEPRTTVAAGDTVGSIYSNETERQLASLSGDLAETLSTLDLYTSGEKEAIIREADLRLQRAQEQLRQHEKELNRLRQLRERELISAQDLELAESQWELYQDDIEIAQAQLEAVRSGAKPQQVALARTRADALQKQIEKLNERIDLYTITTPISGLAVRSFGGDTLLTVRDTTSFVVAMPIPWRDAHLIEPGQEVVVQIRGRTMRAVGHIRQIGDSVHLLNGQQVLLATAFVTQAGAALMPGAITECTIPTGEVSLWEYVRRALFTS